MKRTMLIALTCALTLAALSLIQNASSQPRPVTTRQLQMIGAAATNSTHGAWFVDLQSSHVIFCERASAGVQCHTAAIP